LLSTAVIGQIALPVRDLRRAIEFYRDTLGLLLLFEHSNAAFFDCAGIRLMLAESDRAEREPARCLVYFTVPDIQAAARELERRGVALERQPHIVNRLPSYDLWLAFFRDSEGNPLALISERPRA
jgi:Predicted enzyme related to lactoylglutathione lyase